MKEKIAISFSSGCNLDEIYPRGQTKETSLSAGGMSLAKTLAQFILDNPNINSAQKSVHAAGLIGSTAVKSLFKTLEAADFDVSLMVGQKFKKSLVNACTLIQESVDTYGQHATANILSNGVVRVSDIVIDILFKKFGDHYVPFNNYPFREFKQYWEHTQDVNSLVSLTPEMIKTMLGKENLDSTFHSSPSAVPSKKSKVEVGKNFIRVS